MRATDGRKGAGYRISLSARYIESKFTTAEHLVCELFIEVVTALPNRVSLEGGSFMALYRSNLHSVKPSYLAAQGTMSQVSFRPAT